MILSSGLIIETLRVSPLQANCHIVYDSGSKSGAVIDPGGDGVRILQIIEDHDLDIKIILNTHGHCDHAGANVFLREKTGAPVGIHESDAYLLNDPVRNGAAMFGIPFTPHEADIVMKDGQDIGIGSKKFKLIHTPGHSPGGSCFYHGGEGDPPGVLFSGDTLFAGSIGRTDVPGGDYQVMMESLKRLVEELPGDTVVFAGHGPSTTLIEEIQSNMFLKNIV